MLIVLKQLNVHHGHPGLPLWASSLPTLAEGESIPVGTLNPPEHRGGCASDWTPRHSEPLGGSPGRIGNIQKCCHLVATAGKSKALPGQLPLTNQFPKGSP